MGLKREPSPQLFLRARARRGLAWGGQGGLAGVDLDPPAIEGIFLEPESPKGLATGVANTPHSASPLRVGPEPSRTGGNPSLEGATGGFSLVPLGDGAGGSEESESTSAGGAPLTWGGTRAAGRGGGSYSPDWERGRAGARNAEGQAAHPNGSRTVLCRGQESGFGGSPRPARHLLTLSDQGNKAAGPFTTQQFKKVPWPTWPNFLQ